MSAGEDTTRASWDAATRNHNAHKGDQAGFLRAGGDTLFAEELELLGPLEGRRLVHLQCNSGQDTLCLARRGAQVVGVDFSGEAIAFARGLSDATEIPAAFELAEVLGWMATTPARFDLAFASYGAIGWLADLDAWARGVRRILAPGGRLVLVEFHPIVWSVGDDGGLTGDDYFEAAPFREPVSDYVAASGAGLGAAKGAVPGANAIEATSWQHTLAATLTAVASAGLHIDRVAEWPHANGCRVRPTLVEAPERRWVWPQGAARLPLMWGVSASLGACGRA